MAMIGRNAAISEIGPLRASCTASSPRAWLGVHAWLLSGSRARMTALSAGAGLLLVHTCPADSSARHHPIDWDEPAAGAG